MLTRREFNSTCGALAVWFSQTKHIFAQSPRKLVFIHGRAQEGRSSGEIAEEWRTALQAGVTDAGLPPLDLQDVQVPFYGDELDRISDEFGLPLASEINARGDILQDKFLAFQAEVAREITERTGVTDDEINAEYGDNPRPRGPQNWEWVQALIRAIDRNHDGVSSAFLEKFLRDVFLYTNSVLAKRRIDAIVSAKISREPTIIVAHSLGTVVAYNILKEAEDLDIPLLVTLGSPLGIRAIRNRFRPISYPAKAGAWFNAYDERDVVALYPLDEDNFDVLPRIENMGEIRNQTSNRHGIAGYLDKNVVGSRIYRGLMEED